MGVIQLPDKVLQVIDRAVADGWAGSQAEFVELAVMQMVEDEAIEADPEVLAAIDQGDADIAEGRYTLIASAEDEEAYWSGVQARMEAATGTGAAR